MFTVAVESQVPNLNTSFANTHIVGTETKLLMLTISPSFKTNL